MTVFSDIRDAVRAIADARDDFAQLGLGTPGNYVEINDQKRETGTAWDENSALQILLEGVAEYIGGKAGLKRTTIQNDYLATADDQLIAATSIPGGGLTITLPSSVVSGGNTQYEIKDEAGQAGANPITLIGEGGELIDGLAALMITANYGFSRVYVANGAWWTH